MSTTLCSVDFGAGHFVPVAGWPEWTGLMQLASRAHRSHQATQAMAWYQQCVAMAIHALDGAADNQIEPALEALVGASCCLADLQEEEGAPTLAAQTRGELHQRLVRQMCGALSGHRRSVLASFIHRTHSVLLAHVEAHGPDPAVMAGLRSGCMSLHAGHLPRH